MEHYCEECNGDRVIFLATPVGIRMERCDACYGVPSKSPASIADWIDSLPNPPSRRREVGS